MECIGIDCFDGVDEFDLRSERVSVVYDWLTLWTIPAIHCKGPEGEKEKMTVGKCGSERSARKISFERKLKKQQSWLGQEEVSCMTDEEER